MKTAEPKTVSVAGSTKANRPFFSKKAEGSVFGEIGNKENHFFKPFSAYAVNGNGILQTPLTIGQPNDIYEKEADEVADKVVQRLATPELQQKCEVGIQAKPLANAITPIVQAKCAACEPALPAGRQEEKVQTKSDSPVTSAGIESSLKASKGSGSPLPASTRDQMESSFGTDFSNVRIHTGSTAVRMSKDLHAQAFTHGNDVYFNAGKYDTTSPAGKHLLAHELTHTVQQTSANGFAIQKQDETETEETGTAIPDDDRSRQQWNQRVDDIIRATFSISGARARTRVSYLSPSAFGAAIPAPGIEEMLLNILFSPPRLSTANNILRYNHLALLPSLLRLRTFIRQAMAAGYFEYSNYVPGEVGPQRITPGDLLAEHTGGFTTSSRARSFRRIFMQDLPPMVQTLTHEMVHFYTHNGFSDFANSTTNTDRIEHGLRVQQILQEGFTEYFARKIMRDNEATLGHVEAGSYDPEYREALRIITTMGETAAENAYFRGNVTALRRMDAAMRINFDTHPDVLVPDFMID